MVTAKTHIDDDAPRSKHHRTVKLPSGGSLSFSCEVNLLALPAPDRTFLFGLIDQLDAYEQAQTQAHAQTAAAAAAGAGG